VTLHFSEEELASRRQTIAGDLQARGLDGLLMFRQESMYYLTGYDTFGYVFFQCLFMKADGETMTLLTRVGDLRQAQFTSVIRDIRIWLNRADQNPALELRDILAEHGCRGQRLGIETDAYGLTGYNLKLVEATMEGFCELVEASDIVTRRRAVKSAAELCYVRKAAELADVALDRAVETAGPGAFEGDILAALQGAIYAGGGDPPGNEVVIGSGPRALMVRYCAGMRHLDTVDQLTLEWAGVYRRYHAAGMRTVIVGRASPQQRELFSIVKEGMEAMTEALAPGRPVGEVDDGHRRVLDNAGLARHRLAAVGYSMGTTFQPNWMDWPMLYSTNPVLAEPGNVFFLHCVVLDSDRGLAMSVGRTCLVTASGREVLSRHPLELIIV
jgi:Xaa-Pro dipeptidase